MHLPRQLAIQLALCLLAVAAAAQAPIPPEEFLGHRVGADRKLAPYPKVLEYLRLVDDASDRVSIHEAGTSTLGNEILAVALTSPENQANLERYREIAARLANPDGLSPEEADALVEEGKPIVLITLTIHSTEVGSTQMVMEFVHDFATTEEPDKLAWMDEAILLVMPSINPDGQVMVVDWYDQWVGTEYEGGSMPWLYHHYIGHDNNRDFYMLTQKESRAVNRVLYHDWFPQVFIDEHQMGSMGPRMFVPPQTDPLAPEIHPLIFRQADLLGTNMSFRLEEAGKTGVGHNMIFDSYWPGGTRNTAWWKNVTGLLTEVASARIASPIYIDPGELRGGNKGFPEYKRRANFPSVWPGGWWRLRDIVEYELIATWAALESSALYADEILRNFYRMASAAIDGSVVEGAPTESPSAWVVSPSQHDPVAAARLVELLLEHGIRVYRLNAPLSAGLVRYPTGSWVIPAAQPYRAFLLTMLRPQRYPEVRPHQDGPIIPPYDVTSWSLPISMGVAVDEIEVPLTAPSERIEALRPAAMIVAETAGGWVVPHSADSVFTLMNRLMAREAPVYWLAEAGEGYAAGDIYLPAGAIEAADLAETATELRLPVLALGSVPEGTHHRIAPTRVGLYKPWVASMDEGWTRFSLENYEFPLTNFSNEEIQEGDFDGEVDVMLFPDVGKAILENGEPENERARRFWAPLPPEYAGGLGSEGGERLANWIRGGGTVVALDSSSDYFIDLLDLPVTNVLESVTGDAFSCPGSMLRLLVDTSHPLAYGLRKEEAGYFASSPAFRTALPRGEIDRRVIARYPDHREDVLVSGYLKGAELLERRAAVIEFTVGEGRVILIGFRAQHRAQTVRTFKLLFNALYRGVMTESELPTSPTP